jgi:hypothetical protein
MHFLFVISKHIYLSIFKGNKPLSSLNDEIHSKIDNFMPVVGSTSDSEFIAMRQLTLSTLKDQLLR